MELDERLVTKLNILAAIRGTDAQEALYDILREEYNRTVERITDAMRINQASSMVIAGVRIYFLHEAGHYVVDGDGTKERFDHVNSAARHIMYLIGIGKRYGG